MLFMSHEGIIVYVYCFNFPNCTLWTHFIIILLLSTLFINTSFSQNWLSDMESGHVYSAKTNFDSHWADKTAGKGKGYKQFERWFHHWEPRVFPSGKMSSISYESGLIEHNNISSMIIFPFHHLNDNYLKLF